ncbi:cytochrome d ubiquinol oxidase subunit II [Sutterella sp.]|uniref:cytochrome d ubiquinol oxidase subunit II n=1 Tax=Sutterella sp. TaxID=1981025 RepID=UPI0026DEE89B|nr:cytochrome d ubiquinol oxidase subunit II [Sutterella sp.]MDO5530477.1 cytochrome d ubiquinol oxidase subunit II [Sutterella sp.]
MIDYEILKAIWWLFIGVLLVGFTIMDGQDMGVGSLLPFLGKNDTERRIMINSVAPHWDGNQVWFITGGGAMFAAWPMMYAVAFSGFYWAMLVILLALMLRPLAFDYRSKVPAERWRSSWDWLLFLGSAIPPVICGVAFGNLLQGVPFEIDATARPIYTGSFFGLLNPFGLLCGVLALAMIIFHGANYLALRTEGDLHARAVKVSSLSGVLTAVLFVLGGVWVWAGIDGYVATAGLDPAGPANPLAKTVEVVEGAWFRNYAACPVLWVLPVIGVLAPLAGAVMVRAGRYWLAILCSALTLLGIVLTPLGAMFPFVMPSSTMLNAGLTVWDCTSSQLTLEIMFFVTLIFLPIVLFYTTWAYRVMSGKLTGEYIEKNTHSLY